MLKLLMVVVLGALGAVATASESGRTPLPAPRFGEIRDVTSTELGNFPYDPLLGGNIPADVLALSGLHVRLRGTVTPWDLDGEKVVRFALTDGQSCCFGGPPRIQHVVVVDFPAGMELTLADGWVRVEGVLMVKEVRSSGLTQSLFSVVASAVTASSAPPVTYISPPSPGRP